MGVETVSERGHIGVATVPARLGKRMPPRRRHGEKGRKWLPYLLVAPAALYLVAFMAYPLFEGLRLSVTDTRLLNPRAGEYVGTENYSELLARGNFYKTLWITLVYTVGSVVGAIGIGLLAALGMNRLRGKAKLLRGIVIVPWAAPMIPVALISSWMLDKQFGVVNWMLNSAHLIDRNVGWLSQEDTALPTILAITVWRIFPFSAIVLLAALQGVSSDLYEAAKIDGAGALNRFKNVTIPSVRPTLGVLVLFVTVWSLRRFDLIWVLTEGGPLGSTTTLVIDLYYNAFRLSDLGYGSAIGMVGFGISTVVTAIYFYVQSRSSAALRSRDAR
jgi:multiple sugar transport system permease protein